MELTSSLILILALGIIIGGIMVLKKSARKFDLTKEQLKRIKQREQQQKLDDERDSN